MRRCVFKYLTVWPALVAVLLATGARAGDWPTAGDADALFPELDRLYQELHRAPELSLHEEKTAAKLAARLKALGFEVTAGVGGHGVVGLLRNGPGPTVMIRTDMDGLPVEEATGLTFSSKATAVDSSGATVRVMHACGHDAHMASWVGAATLLSKDRPRWRGTLLLVGQPAEEIGRGARAMLEAGLFTRFPRPDFAVALHVASDIPAGRIEHVSGYAMAGVDSVDITVFGRGGHGARPHDSVDPIVIASRIVLSLQTLVSREKDPFAPAVVTVGSIHGGTKHNIIPSEVRLQLTVRSYEPKVRQALLEGIARIARAEAQAARAPKEPQVVVSESTPAVLNEPALTKRLASSLVRQFGEASVGEYHPIMGGEDFAEYGRAGVPSAILWLGAADPKAVAQAAEGGPPLPTTHSPLFAPDRERVLRIGPRALTAMALELLGKP